MSSIAWPERGFPATDLGSVYESNALNANVRLSQVEVKKFFVRQTPTLCFFSVASDLFSYMRLCRPRVRRCSRVNARTMAVELRDASNCGSTMTISPLKRVAFTPSLALSTSRVPPADGSFLDLFA